MREVDRCVLCGLCLPHCPTYQLTQDENESPRGRISLMRALATGRLPASEPAWAHLSRCLACRNCERVCPSGVHYGMILEAGRAQHAEQTIVPRWPIGALLHVTSSTRRTERSAALLRFYQRSGTRWLARRTGVIRLVGMQRYDDMLPPVPRPRAWPAQCAAEGIRRGRVALFLGCLTRALDVDTVTAAIRLLTRFGYDVRIPEHQGCCGALHREAGDQRRANELQDGNRAAFSGLDVEAIITLASGCGASLTEPPPGTGTLPAPIRDLHEFLAERPVPDGLMFAPLRQHILVQDPCSLRNVLRAEQAVYRLLERVPELRITPLPGNNVCCGGAGGYVLREPELAERLRAPKLDAIAELRPDFVVSANIGCALHVAAGLRRKRLAMPVVHPAVLLARQLRPA